MHGNGLRIDVADDAPGWPVAEAPTDDRSHGRGLLIVAALSTDWGVRRSGNIKHVWALLPLAPHSLSCA